MSFNHPVTTKRSLFRFFGGLLFLGVLLAASPTADSHSRGSQPFLIGLGFLLTSAFGPQAAQARTEGPVHEKLERPGGIYERTVETAADGIKVVLREDLTYKQDGLEGSLERSVTRIRPSSVTERVPINPDGTYVHRIDTGSVFVGLGLLSVGLAILGADITLAGSRASGSSANCSALCSPSPVYCSSSPPDTDRGPRSPGPRTRSGKSEAGMDCLGKMNIAWASSIASWSPGTYTIPNRGPAGSGATRRPCPTTCACPARRAFSWRPSSGPSMRSTSEGGFRRIPVCRSRSSCSRIRR